MNDLSTFYTLQVQMLFTSPSRFYILISSLATFLCNIFDHSSILCKLVQIAVYSGGVGACALLFQMLQNVGGAYRVLTVVDEVV